GTADADVNTLWHTDIRFGNELPMVAAATGTVCLYLPESGRLLALDDRTQAEKWHLDLTLDRTEAPKVRKTAAYGDLLIAKTNTDIRALKIADGTIAWTVALKSTVSSHMLTDRLVVL